MVEQNNMLKNDFKCLTFFNISKSLKGIWKTIFDYFQTG